MLVAFRPPTRQMDGDRLFHADRYDHFGDASHWMEPMRDLAQRGQEAGIEFHTDDVVNLNDAAVCVLGEMPPSRSAPVELRRRHPQLKLILQIIETPVGRQWVFDRANHRDFDAVISYNPSLNDRQRYFACRIPAGGLGTRRVPVGKSFSERKIACMVAQVPHVRTLSGRRTGLGMIRNGWRFTPRTWLNYVAEGGSLYAERLAIAREAERLLGSQFDIFGPGWPTPQDSKNGDGVFRCARGPFAGSKLDLLQEYRFTIAYENCLNDCGYISEKLFDAFLGGCVPVYLGNQSVHKYVDADAFIDVRRYRSHTELIESLAAMSEPAWRSMRSAAEKYVVERAPLYFGSGQYIDTVLEALRQVTRGG